MSTLLNDIPEFEQFTCTSTYHRFWNILLTDGAKYLADTYDCHWLFTLIIGRQANLHGHRFQHWKLEKTRDDTAKITVDDGNGNILHTETVEPAIFNADGVRLYLIDKVALLPREY